MIALPMKEQVYSLGVLLDSELLLDKQVADMVRSVFYQLQLISQHLPFVDRNEVANKYSTCPHYI